MSYILAFALAATAPVPKGKAPFEYPLASIRRGEEGKVDYEIEVDASGQAIACRIVGSSGHAMLDAEACRHVKQMRFQPARDDEGKPVPGVFRSSWEWKLGSRRR
ncbi:energy transducer TonB [Tsuneonella sp. HG222]